MLTFLSEALGVFFLVITKNSFLDDLDNLIFYFFASVARILSLGLASSLLEGSTGSVTSEVVESADLTNLVDFS